MDSARKNFADDLQDVKESLDVGAFLKAVNPASDATPKSEKPVAPRKASPAADAAPSKPKVAPVAKLPELAPTRLQKVTTMLSFETIALLKRMTLSQQLKNRKPATRQDIIEQAISDWAKRQGYLGMKQTAKDTPEEADIAD